MSALALCRAVGAAGGTLCAAAGGRIALRMPAGMLDPVLVAAIRARKAEVLALLRAEAAAVAHTRRRASNALSPAALADEAELTMRGVPLP